MTSSPPVLWKGPYCCVVTSSEEYEPVTPPSPAPSTYNRWIYQLEPVTWNLTENYLDPPASGDRPFQFEKALNMAELKNTGTEIMGIPANQIPSGFSLAAIPDDTVVMAWVSAAVEDENGIGHLCLFYAMNQFTGSCTGFAP